MLEPRTTYFHGLFFFFPRVASCWARSRTPRQRVARREWTEVIPYAGVVSFCVLLPPHIRIHSSEEFVFDERRSIYCFEAEFLRRFTYFSRSYLAEGRRVNA